MHSSDEYHSPEEKEDMWNHVEDIGVGGFGVVKLFVNKVSFKPHPQSRWSAQVAFPRSLQLIWWPSVAVPDF